MSESLPKLKLEDFHCRLCSELPREPVTLPCGHSFCRGCVRRLWDQQHQPSCPQCRLSFPDQPPLCLNVALEALMVQLRTGLVFPGNSEAAPGETEAAPGETEASPGETEASPGEAAPGENRFAPGETPCDVCPESNTSSTSSSSFFSGSGGLFFKAGSPFEAIESTFFSRSGSSHGADLLGSNNTSVPFSCSGLFGASPFSSSQRTGDSRLTKCLEDDHAQRKAPSSPGGPLSPGGLSSPQDPSCFIFGCGSSSVSSGASSGTFCFGKDTVSLSSNTKSCNPFSQSTTFSGNTSNTSQTKSSSKCWDGAQRKSPSCFICGCGPSSMTTSGISSFSSSSFEKNKTCFNSNTRSCNPFSQSTTSHNTSFLSNSGFYTSIRFPSNTGFSFGDASNTSFSGNTWNTGQTKPILSLFENKTTGSRTQSSVLSSGSTQSNSSTPGPHEGRRTKGKRKKGKGRKKKVRL